MPTIETNRIDYLVATLKAISGPIPILGPLFAELFGTVIPQQRLDRLARYIQILDEKLSDLDRELVKARFAMPAFVDLLEDSLHQAIRALTEERLHQIAAIIKNGLSDEHEEYDQYKYVFSLLSEINDTEMIILQAYRHDRFDDPDEFIEKHQDILMAAGSANLDSNQEEVDRSTIHQQYRQHLARLGLLQPRFKRVKKNEFPEFDPQTGTMKASGYKLTPMGRLLLRKTDELPI